jgi:signal transduction histidine kinase/CheY-like chemotaxis protein
MHTLLWRQFKKHFQGLPRLEGPLQAMIDSVDAAYHGFDADRLMLERSLDLSSRELLQANADTRAIFQAFPDLFIRIDASGQILDRKGGSTEEFALPPEELLGKRLQDLPGDGVGTAFGAAIARVGETRLPVRIEYRLRVGEIDLYYEARLVPVLDDQVIVLVRNITERKLFEVDLQHRQERLLRYEAALHELALMSGSDLDESLSRITEASARTLRVARAGVWLYAEGHANIVCEALHGPEAGSGVRGTSLEAKQYPRYFVALEEGRAIAADDACADSRTSEFAGSYLRPLGITSILDVPVRLHGVVVGMVRHEHVGPARVWELDEQNFAASIADLVSLALGAAKRRHLEDQLRQSQKMEAIGLLAGGVAHDFNNSLTAILGYCELMLMTLAPGEPMTEQAEEIKKAALRAAGLTRQLLAFGRRQILDPRILDLHALVGDLRGMLQRLIGEDIELVTVAAPQLGRVRADPGQIEQVIMNLAVNARDAMPGGGRLTIELRDLVLGDSNVTRLGGLRPGPYVLLAVSDTGGGMDERTMQRIFEPFYTTKEPGKGTGLGLSMAYGIVRQSGGQIEVRSEVGRGTVFEIYLPRAEGEDAPLPREAPAPAAASVRSGEVILVVEDEPMVLDLTCSFLQGRGYTILPAPHPAEALRICERHDGPIHLVLTDIVMPGMNGRELYQRLAQLRPRLGALYMSGYTESGIVREGTLEPGTHFIQKPFTLEVLARKLRQALDAAVAAQASAGPGPGQGRH